MDDYDDSAKIGDETSGKHEQYPNTSCSSASSFTFSFIWAPIPGRPALA